MSGTDAERRAAADRELLRRVQLGVLGLLALCALAILVAAEASDLGYADRRFTLGALASLYALGIGFLLKSDVQDLLAPMISARRRSSSSHAC